MCVPECVRECLPVGEGGVKLLVLLYMLYYIDGAVCVCVCACVCERETEREKERERETTCSDLHAVLH